MNLKYVRQLVENISALFSLKAIDLGLSLWLIPYLILKIGLYNYGLYAFSMSFVLFFVNVLNYGFNLATVRELARFKGDKERVTVIFNEVLSVKIFLFILLFTVFLSLSFFVPKFSEHFVLFLCSSLLLVGDLFSLRWFFMGLEKMKLITIIHLFATIIFITLVLAMVRQEEDYIVIPLYEAIGMLISSTVSFIWVIKKHQIKIKLIPIKQILKYLKANFNSFVNLLLPSTFGVFIVFLSGALGVPSYVGLTQIGVKFTGAFATINTILTNVFYPLVNRDEKMVFSTRKILLTLGVITSLLMFLLGGFVTKKWLTLDSETMMLDMVLIIKILSPIPFLAALVSSYGINGLLIKYKDQLFGRITMLATLTMFVLAVFLIPQFPITGAAISFLVARFVYGSLSYIALIKIKRNE